MKWLNFIIITLLCATAWQLQAGDIVTSVKDGVIYYDNGHNKIAIIKLKGQEPRVISKRDGNIWFQMGSQLIDAESSAIYRFNEEKFLLDMFSVDGGQLIGTTSKYFIFEMNLNDEGKGIWLFNLKTLEYKPIELHHNLDKSISLEDNSLICYLKSKKIAIALDQLWKRNWWQPQTSVAQ